MRIHFIGCEGASMKVLRKIAEADGATTSGSDLALCGHDEQFVYGADAVVYTSAISTDNPEYTYAQKNNIPLYSRAEYLGKVAANYETVIAVAGSHGKTTTTAMLGAIFAPYRATVHLGGEYGGECGHVGEKRYFITEACEYRRNFLHLLPQISVVLNVELDHTDYYRDLADITSAFNVFSRSAPVRILCGDDQKSAPLREGKHISFGLTPQCDFFADDIKSEKGGTHFTLRHNGRPLGEIGLRVMGRHNIYNALAAAAAATAAGIPFADIKRGLENFSGVRRRLEYLATFCGCEIFTDYAHHPREIESTLSSLRAAGYKRIGIAFEPHTYSRTLSLLDDFTRVLPGADTILLADIYAAREDAYKGVSSQLLCRKILDTGRTARCYATFFELNEAVERILPACDAFVYCGAGTIDVAARVFTAAR